MKIKFLVLILAIFFTIGCGTTQQFTNALFQAQIKYPELTNAGAKIAGQYFQKVYPDDKERAIEICDHLLTLTDKLLLEQYVVELPKLIEKCEANPTLKIFLEEVANQTDIVIVPNKELVNKMKPEQLRVVISKFREGLKYPI